MKYSYLCLSAFVIALFSLTGTPEAFGFSFGVRNDIKKAEQLVRTNPEDALAIYTRLLDKKLSDEIRQEVLYASGRLLERLDRSDEARQFFEQAESMAIESDFRISARIELMRRRSGVNSLENIVDLQHAASQIKNKDLQDRASFLIGMLQYDSKLFADALVSFRRAVSIRSEDSRDAYRLWLLSARCNINLKSFPAALKDIERAIELHTFAGPEAFLEKFRIQVVTDPIQKAVQSIPESCYGYTGELGQSIETVLTELPYEQLKQIDISAVKPELKPIILKVTIRKSAESGNREDALNGLNQIRETDPSLVPGLEEFITEITDYDYQKDDTIGLLIPLSGDLASIGMSIFRGASLAVESFNVNFPETPLKLITKDTRESSELIESEFNNLVNNDQVIAIVGPVKSSSAKRVAELSSEMKIPVITPGCPIDSIPSTSDFLYRVFPSVEREAFILCHYFNSIYATKRIAVVYPDIDYGNQALNGIQRAISAASSSGTELVFSVKYPENSMNYTSYLTGLKSADPDLIIIPDKGERAALIVNHIRYLDMLSVPVAGTGEWESPHLIQIGGSNIENAIFINEFPMLTASRQQLQNEYISRYGEAPDPFACRSYEILSILGQAHLGGVRTRAKLKSFLESSFQGLDGLTHFSKEGFYLPALTVFRIQNSRAEPIAQFVSNEFIAVPPTPTPAPASMFTPVQ